MSDTATFFAAKLVDDDCKVEFNRHCVTFSTREELLEAAEALKKENHTPEQINGMLGVILAHAGEMLTDEDKNTVFQGISPAESTDPYVILITAENRQLVYGAIKEYMELGEKDAKSAVEASAQAVEDADKKLVELSTRVSAKDVQIDELTGKITTLQTELEDAKKASEAVGKEDYDPEGLKAQIAKLQESLGNETERIEAEVTKRTTELSDKVTSMQTRNESLEKIVAKLSTERHEQLAREAAHLAMQNRYPAAKGKSFTELCESFATRSQESLKDLISDLFPVEGSTSPAKPGTVDPGSVERVDDPTNAPEAAVTPKAPVAGETPLQNAMANSLTDIPEQTFQILGFTQRERDDINQRIARCRQAN